MNIERATPTLWPVRLRPLTIGSCRGPNHCTTIALLTGKAMPTLIPKRTRRPTRVRKSEANGARAPADMRRPAPVSAAFSPIREAKKLAGIVIAASMIVTTATSRLTVARERSKSSMISGKSGAGAKKLAPIAS